MKVSNLTAGKQLDSLVARERDSLAAYVERLRGCLSAAYYKIPFDDGLAIKIGDILDESPTTSLADRDKRIRDEVIEECAACCTDVSSFGNWGINFAKAIRLLKGNKDD